MIKGKVLRLVVKGKALIKVDNEGRHVRGIIISVKVCSSGKGIN